MEHLVSEPLREVRVRMQLEVRVWGMGSDGKPFSQTARTIDISGNGARLEGVACLKQVGEIVGVQHGSEKARFRVVWIGDKDTAQEGQIAITSVDASKCIWGHRLQHTVGELGLGSEIPDLGAAPMKSPPSPPGGAAPHERRRYPRYHCIGKVLLRQEGTDNFASAKLTDIGLGGCYMETFSPLPLQTPVELIIQADELEIRARGVVRTLHPSMGNGIGFTQVTADDWRRLDQLIARVSSPAPHEVPVHAVKNVACDLTPALRALVLLLEKKGVLTRDEFLSELMRVEPRLRR